MIILLKKKTQIIKPSLSVHFSGNQALRRAQTTRVALLQSDGLLLQRPGQRSHVAPVLVHQNAGRQHIRGRHQARGPHQTRERSDYVGSPGRGHGRQFHGHLRDDCSSETRAAAAATAAAGRSVGQGQRQHVRGSAQRRANRVLAQQ